jgi:hypothetical protein
LLEELGRQRFGHCVKLATKEILTHPELPQCIGSLASVHEDAHHESMCIFPARVMSQQHLGILQRRVSISFTMGPTGQPSQDP